LAAFRAGFLAPAFIAFPASARFSAHRFFVAAMMAALPARLSLRLGFGAAGAAFDGGADCLARAFFAVLEDACKLTASFARVTAAFAS